MQAIGEDVQELADKESAYGQLRSGSILKEGDVDIIETLSGE